MRQRWDMTRRYWDDFHLRNQHAYCSNMKRLGPSGYSFACLFISKRRAEYRNLLRKGVKPDRLILSDFRLPRKFLPRERKP